MQAADRGLQPGECCCGHKEAVAMSDGHGLTDQELEKLRAVGEITHGHVHDVGIDDPVDHPPSLSTPLSPAACQYLRLRHDEGDISTTELAQETDVSRMTVWRHVFGKCSHDLSAGRVDIRRCAVAREMALDDQPLSLIKSRLSVGDAVRRHIRGDCSHEHAVPPTRGRRAGDSAPADPVETVTLEVSRQ
jgi:hypothetical protein